MKRGWQIKRLGDVCDFDKAQGVHRGLPYVGLENIESSTGRFIGSTDPQPVRSSTFRFSTKHVLYGRLRPYLKKAIAPDFEGHCSTEIFPIKPSPSVSRKYLLYWLLADKTTERINGTCTGARMPRADMNEVLDFDFPLPPLAEQQRIVEVLDEAFAGLATAQANATKNLQNAHAIFEGHLGDVFTRQGQDWFETTIGNVCTLKSGTTVPAALEKASGDIPYLKVADMTLEGNENQVSTSSRFLRKTDVRASAVIPAGATIFPKRGGAILTNKKRMTATPICADLNVMAVIPSAQLNAELLYLYFLNVDMRKLGTGSSIPQINNYDIAPLPIAFPRSRASQRELVGELTELRGQVESLSSIYGRKLDSIGELKKSLLHQAFTGNL